MLIKIEAGKKYKIADGSVYGPMIKYIDCKDYSIYTDETKCVFWDEFGMEMNCVDGYNLIEEV
jgi:hypothetical protein